MSNGYAQQQAATRRMIAEMQSGVGRIHDEAEAQYKAAKQRYAAARILKLEAELARLRAVVGDDGAAP